MPFQDENLLWSTIRRTVENLREEAPQGLVPRVQVNLGDGETIEPGGVQYVGPWLFFEIDQEGDEVTERHRVIAIRPERIGRVEIRLVPADGRPVGFRAPDVPRSGE